MSTLVGVNAKRQPRQHPLHRGPLRLPNTSELIHRFRQRTVKLRSPVFGVFSASTWFSFVAVLAHGVSRAK